MCVCEHLAQIYYVKVEQPESNMHSEKLQNRYAAV